MKRMEQKILQDGKIVNEHVLLVDSFINNQIDVELMAECGKEFARHYKDAGITRICTVESSGIAPAVMTAYEMKLPLVVLKKSKSAILKEDILQTEVYSFTKESYYQLTLKKKFIQPGDRVLLIDDFLANGEVVKGSAQLIEAAGATLAGIGILICKAAQPGYKLLKEKGYDLHCLAKVADMTEGVLHFEE